jgi:hypothetical protein
MSLEYDILQDKIEFGDIIALISATKRLCGIVVKTQNDMKKYQDKYMTTLSVEDANIYRSVKERNKRMKQSLKLRIEALYEALHKDKIWEK